MFKRIVIGILAVVLAAFTLCGCSFFTHDNERDMQQVVATVESYTIENTVADEDGEHVRTVKYVTAAQNIYKRDLVEYVNNNASNLSSSYGSDYEGMYRYAASMLVNMVLVENEVNALIAPDCGKIEWGVKQENLIRQSIYSVIDNTLTSLKNNILSERDQESIVTDGDSDINTDTTYPVKSETVDDDDDEGAFPEKVWEPSKSKYPGLSGDLDTQSLEREAMRRFIALIKSRIEDDFRITSEQRAKFDKEIAAIDNLIETKGIAYVYPVIGNYYYGIGEYSADDSNVFGYIMYYISGKSIERSQKISSLQEYLSNMVTVNNSEVVSSFTTTLNEQRKQYTTDVSAYDSAMSGGSTTVLYHPNNNYFYVKHILLPFSDEQTDALKAYKASSAITSLHEDEQKERINEYRERLADSIVAYPHVNGENDLSRPMSVDQVLDHIYSVMRPLEANTQNADLAFDDLIYLYNTDPGAFGNNKGYVVKYKLGEGESETYMQEFADAARHMRDNLEVGQVYYEKVITDYGVHIMYLASVTEVGAVSLYDYTTPGKVQTYYDILEEPINTARTNAAYTTWENNVLSYNYNKHSSLIVDAFSDLWEDR